MLRTGRVATADERNGVFSSTIRDPLTGLPFLNNTIPANRIDPVARNVMNLVPLLNTTGTNNFIRQPNVEDNGERYLLRTDLKAGGNDTIFVRYIYTDRTRFEPGSRRLVDACPRRPGGATSSPRTFDGGWLDVGLQRVDGQRGAGVVGARSSDGQQDPFGQTASEIGFQGVPANPTVTGGIVGIEHLGPRAAGLRPTSCRATSTRTRCSLRQLSWLKANTPDQGRHRHHEADD
ncbi:MAG: hypothetical protein R2712_24860 [Vicinamibacterales bacterium]